jgi:TRAP-type C4-dicarboxylate transport system permease small subunit
MIWIVYIGVSQSVEAKSELKIDIISKIFKSPKAERILYLISTSISMVVCASIVFYGFRFTAFLKGVEQRPASFDIPMYLIYGIIPVSALLMMIKYAARMRAVFRNN